MIPWLRWILHGEDAAGRVALVIAAGACYVTGAGWRPDDPVWWAAGIGACLAAASSRPLNGRRVSAADVLGAGDGRSVRRIDTPE